ncbi:hypothetical protein LTR04_002570, partial [Oleoguttula sp. CCFEE 6159]
FKGIGYWFRLHFLSVCGNLGGQITCHPFPFGYSMNFGEILLLFGINPGRGASIEYDTKGLAGVWVTAFTMAGITALLILWSMDQGIYFAGSGGWWGAFAACIFAFLSSVLYLVGAALMTLICTRNVSCPNFHTFLESGVQTSCSHALLAMMWLPPFLMLLVGLPPTKPRRGLRGLLWYELAHPATPSEHATASEVVGAWVGWGVEAWEERWARRRVARAGPAGDSGRPRRERLGDEEAQARTRTRTLRRPSMRGRRVRAAAPPRAAAAAHRAGRRGSSVQRRGGGGGARHATPPPPDYAMEELHGHGGGDEEDEDEDEEVSGRQRGQTR